jgi:hypothetical protein
MNVEAPKKTRYTSPWRDREVENKGELSDPPERFEPGIGPATNELKYEQQKKT